MPVPTGTITLHEGSPTTNLTVNFGTTFQTIDGFGASDRNSLQMNDAQADMFFTTSSGIGLTFLRTTMYEDGNSTYASNHQRAAARGARVWFAPWTAPGNWKDNGSTSNGGHLLVARYSDWADRMCGFHATLLSEGVNLYAMSVQGEPNWSAPYPSMLYSASEMVAFLKVLGPKVAVLNPKPLIMLPETIGGTGGGASGVDCQGYVNAVLGDATAAQYLDIVAQHQYNGVATISTGGHPSWQTEMSSFEAFDASINHGLTVAGWIHDSLANCNLSAWHYWEIIGGNQNDNESLVGYSGNPTQITKRFYTLGNYSKYVRPGYVRVGTTGSINNISLTAYKEASTGKIAVVAINPLNAATSGVITFNGLTLSSLIPHRTTSSLNLVDGGTIPVSGNSFIANFPAQSVTTFTGTGV